MVVPDLNRPGPAPWLLPLLPITEPTHTETHTPRCALPRFQMGAAQVRSAAAAKAVCLRVPLQAPCP